MMRTTVPGRGLDVGAMCTLVGLEEGYRQGRGGRCSWRGQQGPDLKSLVI